MKDVAEEEMTGTRLPEAEPFDDGRKTGARVGRPSNGASELRVTAHETSGPDVMMPAQFFESCKKTVHIDEGIQRLMVAVLELAIADWEGAVGSLAGRKLRYGRDADKWIFATLPDGSSFTDGRTTLVAGCPRLSEASGRSSTAIEKGTRAAREGAEPARVVLLPAESPFSFENICTVLGIDADYLRGGLRRWQAAFVADCGNTDVRVTGGASEASARVSTRSEKPRCVPVLGFAHSHTNQVRATPQLTPKPEGSRNRQGGRFRAGAEF